MKLYRPVGLYEMEKILDTNSREYPQRYPDQPIFYPVLNETYAEQIARKWNQNDESSGFAGFVTEFDVNDDYIKKFSTHCVGSSIHQELWIPAEELREFNENILDGIWIKTVFYGNYYKGIEPLGVTGFKEKNIDKQIEILKGVLEYNRLDFNGTVFVEWKLINLNLLYWLHNSCCYNETFASIISCLKNNNKIFIAKNIL